LARKKAGYRLTEGIYPAVRAGFGPVSGQGHLSTGDKMLKYRGPANGLAGQQAVSCGCNSRIT